MSFSLSQSLIDMYENYQAIQACKSFSDQDACESFPNPCCRYANLNSTNQCGQGYECLYFSTNYWVWEKPGLLRYFVCMITQCIIQFMFLFLYETGYLRKIKYLISNHKNSAQKELVLSMHQSQIEELYGDIKKDSDVIEEEDRISKMTPSSKVFIVDKLTKYYDDFMAVKGISFAISNSECFGLLGIFILIIRNYFKKLFRS
jgi:hypothetical protein